MDDRLFPKVAKALADPRRFEILAEDCDDGVDFFG